MKFDRVYHPYTEWEEIRFNMWGSSISPEKHLKLAIKLTGDHKKYGRFMLKVIEKWPKSCENALTDSALNKKAWIGHAACALAIKCPEHITRKAWGELTNEQRILANREAERAIRIWGERYAKSKGVYQDMGVQVLL